MNRKGTLKMKRGFLFLMMLLLVMYSLECFAEESHLGRDTIEILLEGIKGNISTMDIPKRGFIMKYMVRPVISVNRNMSQLAELWYMMV